MNKNLIITMTAFLSSFTLAAQSRENFAKQQAYAEMQRVAGQIDVLQNNFDDLQHRVSRLEGGNQNQSLRAEIDSLRSAIAELRRELSAQRGEIVRDLTGRISAIQKEQQRRAPAPAPEAPKNTYKGECQEYVVASGDTLSLIAQAFNTKVSVLKGMNSLKSDNLRIGQKLLVPKVKD